MIGLWLEEIEAGQVVELGSHHFTAEAIIDFARKYDPQPFHLSEEGGRKGPFGVLSASGWHTGSAWMKCYVATNQAAEAKLRAEGREPAVLGPSPGFDNLRWLKPVFAGETLTGRATVLSRRVSAKRPEMGILKMKFELMNTAGELKAEIIGIQFMRVRNP